jgi:hypothetical protein
MADEGPTTVGSIVGHLRLDHSEWDRDLTDAGARADELGRHDPNIRIDTNAGEVVAALAGVDAALKRVDAAERASANAASASYIANLRLEELQKKRGVTELQLAAATEAAARADRNAEAAELKHMAATAALTAAQAATTTATDEDTAATERNSVAQQGNVSRIGAIITACLTLGPALIPIAGFAVGAAGGLTLMGVSGVLAIKGIKDEMAKGTAAGNEYAAGLHVLTGDLNGLSHTAADAMLKSFNGALAEAHGAMPMLNTEVSQFSTLLGMIGGNVLTGVISGLHVLSPLLLNVGIYMERLSAAFASGAAGDAFHRFADYAVSVLPTVEQFLESVVTAAFHIVEAFAPIGSVVVGVLTFLMDAINAIPVQVLTDVSTVALIAFGAFKLWGAVPAILDAVSTAMALVGVTTEIAAGPIGWVVLGVSALAAIFAVSAVNTQQATKSTQDYTQAIRDDNDALGVHVAAQARKALADDGALKAAQALGISTNDVTNAVLGQGGAAERVASQIRALEATYQSANNNSASYRTGQVALTDTQKANKDAVEKLKGAMDSESQAVKDQLAQQKILKEAQDATTTAQLGGAVAVQQAAAAYGMSVPEYLAATQAQQGTDQATRTATEAMQLQNDAAGILKQSLDKLNGKSISAADAQNAFDSSLVNMGDHVSATGKKITFTTTSISDMSSASVSLRGQLNGQISQLQGVVEANGGLANSTGKAREQMVTMRQQIIDNAVAHGVDRDAVTKYVDSILAIPKTVPPTKLDVDAAEAAA